MKAKPPLWRITVATTADAEDALCEFLAGLTGLAAVAYYHLESRVSHISVFMEQGTFVPAAMRKQISAELERIQGCGLDIGIGKVKIARVKREDWAESWKRHFKPMIIKGGDNGRGIKPARSLLVKPSWSKRPAAKNQALVVLDPGLSFGTGQHPTTSFCLREIVRGIKLGERRSFLDIGTGSGILAIAAAKLGYAPVQAFDFDPDSVRVAGENARKNHVAGRLKLTQGDITRMPLKSMWQFDLVCANLISTLLIAERRRIVNRVKPGGTLVLAGILAAEFSEVERAFADLKLKPRSRRVEKEWCSGAFCFG